MSPELDEMEDDVEAPSAPFWMTTFSDMVTLLLVFFVLIVSMSSVQVEKFKEALSYFQGQTGVLKNKAVVPSSTSQVNTPSKARNAENYREFIAKLKEKDLADKVQVNLTEQGIHVTITDSLMFRSGQAILIDPSRTILRLLSEVITEDVKSIVTEGHTDTEPISTAAFPSNWELSAARAASVIRFLQNQENALPPDRYIAIGYGEHHPRASNATAEGRAKNRRVEILLSWQPWQNKISPQLPKQPKTEE